MLKYVSQYRGGEGNTGWQAKGAAHTEAGVGREEGAELLEHRERGAGGSASTEPRTCAGGQVL